MSGYLREQPLAGMDWILGLGARVLNLSLGFRGWWPDFLAITRILRRKGVLPVIAVGNEYAGSSRSPGNYREALSVGAVGPDDRMPDFSSSERFFRRVDPVVPDLVAPGVGIVSAKPGGGYQEMVFVERVVDQPEVASASANRRRE